MLLCKKCKRAMNDDAVYCPYCGTRQQRQRAGRRRGNGEGSVYLRGKTWQAEVVVGQRYNAQLGHFVPVRRYKGGFATKREAVEYIPILRQEVERPAALTLDHLWRSWSSTAMLKLSQSKQTHYRTAFQKLAGISYRDIATLSIDDLQGVVDEQAPTNYPAKDIKTLLSHLYRRAQAERIVPNNLADFIVLPPLEEKEQQAFSEPEILSLWQAYGAGNQIAGYALLMIYTGMMPGELFKAEKQMIDWERQVIVGCGMKTKVRKRTPIVIADQILPVLRDLCEQTTGSKLISIRRDVFYREFDQLLRDCGCRDLTPYACRHTTATALALEEVAPSVIKQVMRHSKFSTTQRYIHIDTAPMLRAVNGLHGGGDFPDILPTETK